MQWYKLTSVNSHCISSSAECGLSRSLGEGLGHRSSDSRRNDGPLIHRAPWLRRWGWEKFIFIFNAYLVYIHWYLSMLISWSNAHVKPSLNFTAPFPFSPRSHSLNTGAKYKFISKYSRGDQYKKIRVN